MAPRVPNGYEDLRRQEILAAAYDLFGEKGYHQATIRDLAAHMGVSTGVIYTYFTGKEKIFDALQEQSLERNAAFIKRLTAQESLRESLALVLAEFAECWKDAQGRRGARISIGLLVDAMRQRETRTKALVLYEHFTDALVGACVKGKSRGELAADIDPQACGSYLMALFFGLQIQSSLLDRPDFSGSLEGIKRILVENIWSQSGAQPVNPAPKGGSGLMERDREPGEEA